ncbi:MAG: hypothetical protein L3K00_08390 [Thermoplasmata archaeon]|nr:hypothetical protein [Thermoplasmata archaeon]
MPSPPLSGTLTPPAERPGNGPPKSPRPEPGELPAPPRRRSIRVSERATPSIALPVRLFDRPTSVLVYGPSRPLVNLVVFALAEATTPKYHWVDICVPGEQRLEVDPVRLGWIHHDRLWSVENPAALRPDPLAADSSVFGLVRFDEPQATVTQITEFLRLPEMSQRILSTPLPARGPGVVAVPNAHRVMASFSADRVGPILKVHRTAGYSVYVGFADAAGDERKEFEYVIRLDGESLSHWETSPVVCERGVVSGPMADETPVSLGDVPLLAGVFGRALAPA